jgi:hypothetical protein
MKEMNDFLINLFTGNDELRPSLSFPNVIDGVVYATDGVVLIAIPEAELSLKYKTHVKGPNGKKMFDDFEAGKRGSIDVKTSDIAKELARARRIIDCIPKPCKECEGAGDVIWGYTDKSYKDYYKDDDCPVCKGKGNKKFPHPFARVSLSMIDDEKTYRTVPISIGELCFHPFQLYRLFMVALARKCEAFTIYFSKEKYGKAVARFGNIKVLIMLMTKSKYYNTPDEEWEEV